MVADHKAALLATSMSTETTIARTKEKERQCKYPKSQSARARKKDPGGTRQVKSLMAQGPHTLIFWSIPKTSPKTTGLSTAMLRAMRVTSPGFHPLSANQCVKVWDGYEAKKFSISEATNSKKDLCEQIPSNQPMGGKT